MFKEKYDYMFKKEIANLPTTPEFVRKDFERWWNQLSDIVDKDMGIFRFSELLGAHR